MSIKSLYQKKWIRIPYLIILYAFAAYGAFLVLTYVAMKFRWTNEAGSVDANNRYFQAMHDKYNKDFKVDSVSMRKNRYEVLNRILLLNEYFPKNAEYILTAYKQTNDERIALKMLDAVDLQLKSNVEYQEEKGKLKERTQANQQKVSGLTAFEWMNIEEWQHFKVAISKDKKWIDSAAKVTGVEARYIVSCLVGEQVRLFNSRRERFKHLVAPLKTLALEANMSYGVTGIKDHTARAIESYLKDTKSQYYCGKKYEHLLDFDSTQVFAVNSYNDTLNLRLRRLVQFDNHYYSYLYTALFIRQINMQWERAGFPIDDRPEIFASLFNLGYNKSKPKKYPSVGGSEFNIRDKRHTFGAVAFDFYYSGELCDMFPFQAVHFAP